MFLKFGSKHSINGANDSLYLEWTDGYAASHTIDVFDIDSIRQPDDVELRLYPFAIPANSFFISIALGFIYNIDEELFHFCIKPTIANSHIMLFNQYIHHWSVTNLLVR